MEERSVEKWGFSDRRFLNFQIWVGKRLLLEKCIFERLAKVGICLERGFEAGLGGLFLVIATFLGGEKGVELALLF